MRILTRARVWCHPQLLQDSLGWQSRETGWLHVASAAPGEQAASVPYSSEHIQVCLERVGIIIQCCCLTLWQCPTRSKECHRPCGVVRPPDGSKKTFLENDNCGIFCAASRNPQRVVHCASSPCHTSASIRKLRFHLHCLGPGRSTPGLCSPQGITSVHSSLGLQLICSIERS